MTVLLAVSLCLISICVGQARTAEPFLVGGAGSSGERCIQWTDKLLLRLSLEGMVLALTRRISSGGNLYLPKGPARPIAISRVEVEVAKPSIDDTQPRASLTGPNIEGTTIQATTLKVGPIPGLHIVVDTGANKLYLRDSNNILLNAVCSTGSGRQLIDRERSWTFRTPRGSFTIMSIVRDPVWRKPDWAFIEEGKPIPEDESKRYQRGVLGEYALAFQSRYFIHGSLYDRFLGKSVTHGCIRLGSQDLTFLSRKVHIGTPVYIF